MIEVILPRKLQAVVNADIGWSVYSISMSLRP
jgi:hypothetical protein